MKSGSNKERDCLIVIEDFNSSIIYWRASSGKNADTTSFLDSLFSSLGEDLGSDDDGDLGESALAQHLKVTLIRSYIIIIYSFGNINYRYSVLGFLSLESCLF